jgi:hypothetical protein
MLNVLRGFFGRKGGYQQLLVALQDVCGGPASVVKPYQTYDGDAAIKLEVLEPRLGYPPYFHVGWVPGKWARGTVFGPQTRDVDLELLRYAYEQATAWYEVAGEQLVQDFRAPRPDGAFSPGEDEENLIRVLTLGGSALENEHRAEG